MATTSALATKLATSPDWLHTLAQAAGTLLLLELLLALAIVCALMGGLAYAAWWVHRNVIPVVESYGEQAQQVMEKAGRGGEVIVEKVASFHGARAGLLTGLRVFLFGKADKAPSALQLRAAAPTEPLRAPAGRMEHQSISDMPLHA